MSYEKLSEPSKPAGFVSKQAQTLLNSGETASIRPFFDVQGSSPLYSQEYVSALLAELEAKDKRIAELENNPTIKHMRAVEEALVYATDRASELEASQSELAGALGSYIRFAELRRRELGGLSDEMEKVDAIARNAYIAAGFTVGDE